jgi:hypothetical protein
LLEEFQTGGHVLMHSEATSTSNFDAGNGLPAVIPPSGKFISQLFLVPFLIVSAVVGFLLIVNWLVGGPQTPQQFLHKLDNPNPDIRWRGAEDLAQVLLRDSKLASDPHFTLDLAERVNKELLAIQNDERGAPTPRSQSVGQNSALADKDLEKRREYLFYLTSCLGNAEVGVGAPVLDLIALEPEGYDQQAVALRRRQAVWALAKLGENLKRFDLLPANMRAEVVAGLEEEAKQGTDERAPWAKASLEYLQGSQAKNLACLGVDRVFARCAVDPDPFLRELVAYALNFWDGGPDEAKQIDELLDKLSRDDGHGEDVISGQQGEAEDKAKVGRSMTSSPGSKIRFNATVALARRGSASLRLGSLAEMLDEESLRRNFRLRLKDGQEIGDEALIATTLTTAMRALLSLHELQPAKNLSELQPALAKLEESSDPTLSSDAKVALSALGMR